MTDTTKLNWQIEPFFDTYDLPRPLFEVRVKDWSTGLVGDYRGCVVAYIPGGYANDLDTGYVAAENAALIAKAPEMAAEIDRLTAERNDGIIALEDAQREIGRLRAVNAAQSDMLKGAALAAAEVTRERDALRKAVDDLAAEKTALTEMIRGMMEANAEAVDAPKVGDKVRISLTAFIPDDALFQQAQRDRAVLEVADYSPVPKLYVVLYAGRHMTFSAHELDVIEADHA